MEYAPPAQKPNPGVSEKPDRWQIMTEDEEEGDRKGEDDDGGDD